MKTIKTLSLILFITLISITRGLSQDCKPMNGAAWRAPFDFECMFSPTQKYVLTYDRSFPILRVWDTTGSLIHRYEDSQPKLKTHVSWVSDEWLMIIGSTKIAVNVETKKVIELSRTGASGNGKIYWSESLEGSTSRTIWSFDLDTEVKQEVTTIDVLEDEELRLHSTFFKTISNDDWVNYYRYTSSKEPYSSLSVQKINSPKENNVGTALRGYDTKVTYLLTEKKPIKKKDPDGSIFKDSFENNDWSFTEEKNMCPHAKRRYKFNGITQVKLTNAKLNKSVFLVTDLSEDVPAIKKRIANTKKINLEYYAPILEEVSFEQTKQQEYFLATATPEELALFNQKKAQEDKLKQIGLTQIKKEAHQLFDDKNWIEARAKYQVLVDEGSRDKVVFENHAICSYKLNEGDKVWKTIRILTGGSSFTSYRYDYYEAEFEYYDNLSDTSEKYRATGALKDLSNIALRKGDKELAYSYLTQAANYALNDAKDYIKAIVYCRELLEMKPEKTEWANAEGKACVMEALEVHEDDKASLLWDALGAFEIDKNSPTSGDSRAQEVQVRAVLKSMGKL